jgi:mercuric ion transport protein
MKSENISTMGTVLTSFLAASCCIGPAIFVLFGASAGFLGKLTFFETYRPYLLTAGFLMLGFSFWKLFLKKQDCNCKEDVRARKIARGIWWFGFAALVFAATFQPVLLWIYA